MHFFFLIKYFLLYLNLFIFLLSNNFDLFLVNLMINVENLTKNFGNFTAVDNLTLSIHDGEVFGFLGPNGAGKTTTIRMLSC